MHAEELVPVQPAFHIEIFFATILVWQNVVIPHKDTRLGIRRFSLDLDISDTVSILDKIYHG